MSEADMVYGTSLSLESVKVIAESVGVGNLPDEGAKQLADDVSYRLKQIVQVSFQQILGQSNENDSSEVFHCVYYKSEGGPTAFCIAQMRVKCAPLCV
jgi:hypothetical protein